MLATLLTVSGYAFWIIIGIVVLLDMLILSDVGDAPPGFAVFLSSAALIGTVLFTDAFAGYRLISLALGLASYLAVGVIWSAWKWYGFLVSVRDDLRKEWEKTSPRQEWTPFVTGRIPTASRNKDRLTAWATLWPFSLSWWVLTWPRRAFAWLYERLSTVFDRIAARVFAS